MGGRDWCPICSSANTTYGSIDCSNLLQVNSDFEYVKSAKCNSRCLRKYCVGSPYGAGPHMIATVLPMGTKCDCGLGREGDWMWLQLRVQSGPYMIAILSNDE